MLKKPQDAINNSKNDEDTTSNTSVNDRLTLLKKAGRLVINVVQTERTSTEDNSSIVRLNNNDKVSLQDIGLGVAMGIYLNSETSLALNSDNVQRYLQSGDFELQKFIDNLHTRGLFYAKYKSSYGLV